MLDEKVTRAKWESKPCDICGEEIDLIPLGRRIYHRLTDKGPFEFVHNDVICGSCGFVFAGMVPDEEFLREYYKLTFAECLPNFDIESRLEIVGPFLEPGGSILELGSNAGEFAEAMGKAGYVVKCFDIMSVDDRLPVSEQFDMVAGYYILEHVPYPRKWLIRARRYIKPNGYILLEVPNFVTNSGPSMFPEHLVHFSTDHMRMLLESSGFEVVHTEAGRGSRHFGFVTVARYIVDERIQMYRAQYLNPSHKYPFKSALKKGRRADREL
jgi:SAM-dependent methyltransferase